MQDIYTWIKQEESKYETNEINVGDNWNWNMRNHIQMIFHLYHSQFFSGENNWLRFFKNIFKPIVDLCNWTEDIELKNIVFFIESTTGRVLSFLIKKYHDEVYVRENDLDTFIDEITESDNLYGGVLVQDTDGARPEVLPMTSIAFCDQTNMLNGPVAFKHYFSPSQLRKMSKQGWGNESNGATISIEDLIILAETGRTNAGSSQKNETTGKNIEVYIVKGSMPEAYLLDNDEYENWFNQVQIVAFYTNKDSEKEGVTLYRRKDKEEGSLMFNSTSNVDGRSLGFGIGEQLLQPQIWTNFSEIHKMGLIESSSKITLYSDDDSFANRNKVQDMENLEIAKISETSKYGVRQIPTASPTNIQIFTNNVNDLYSHAQLLGSAFDPIMGEQPVSGTTFRGQERIVQQGKGAHNKKKGQRAKFVEMIYRKIIIPKMVKEITKGKEFLASLNAEEIRWISEQLATNYANKMEVEMVLNGNLPPNGMTFQELKEINKQKFLKEFNKKGDKHLIEILKDEFKGVEVKIGINVEGKQKDLFGLSEKVLSIFQTIFANPGAFQQAMQIPALARSFENILEFGGLNPSDFASLLMSQPQQQLQPQELQQSQESEEPEESPISAQLLARQPINT